MEITDSELRERLINMGFNPPPITSTSRNILIKKLMALETNTTMESVIDSNEYEEVQTENFTSEFSEKTADGTTHRLQKSSVSSETKKSNFFPENVGIYSRCCMQKTNFWDRIGTLGTFFLLFLATSVLFFTFKFLNDWNDRQYRNIYSTDGIYPNCNDGGHVGVTCVPDSELKFTESNLNNIRAALHHATLTECWLQNSLRNNNEDFVGTYPVFKDDYIENLLIKELGFNAADSKTVLKNAKVLFKMNPRLDVKVLNDGLMFRNPRLLRSCGYMSKNTIIFTYAVYFSFSLAAVWFTYKLHRMGGITIRPGKAEQQRRLIKDIYDILKQNQRETGDNFMSVETVREWLTSVVNLQPKLWDDTTNYLKQCQADMSLERRILLGSECDVFCLKK